MNKKGMHSHKGLILGLVLSLSLPLIAIRATAQGGSIELAVDTANFNQDGLLVLFGGLRRQGEIGLPVAAGDINGDGNEGNDLIYIPRNQSEIVFEPYVDQNGATVTAAQQWAAFDAFIEQDDYLKSHRGQIAERFGALNPWFSNIDLRVLQDIAFMLSGQKHTFQISCDILNVANLLNSDWGVRSTATAAATSPLQIVHNPNGTHKFAPNGWPVLNYKGTATKTFVDDPGLNSRWQIQLGVRYLFNQ